MAVLEAVKTGPWTTKSTWKVVGKEETKVPTESDDCIIPTGFSVTVSVGAVCRSWKLTGGTLAGTETLTCGTATINGEGYIVWVSSGTITWTGKLKLNSSSLASVTVTSGGKTFGSVELNGGLYQQLDNFATSGTFLTTNSGGTWDQNGHELTAAGQITWANNTHLKLAGTTMKSTGAGISFSGTGGAETTIEDNAATVYSIASAATFATAGRTVLGKLEAPTNSKITGSGGFGAIADNSAGATAGNGLVVTAGTVQTVSGAITTNGTKASPARMESDTGGSRFAVKGPGVNMKTAGTLILKDVEYTGGGTWYVEGEGSEGTNTAGIVFGAEPAGKKTQEVEGLLTGQARTTAETVKSSPVTATLTTKGVLAASTVKIATALGTLTTRAGMTAAQKLVAVSTGRLSNLAALRSTTGGHVFAVEGTMTGNAAITGAAVRSLPVSGTLAARAKTTATQKLVAASSASITAQPRTTATLRVTYRTTASLTARPVLAGVVESTVTTGHAVLITVRNYKQTEITVVNRKQVEIAVVNRKQAEIGVSNL